MASLYTLTIDGREPPAVFAAFDADAVPYTRTNLDCGDFELASDTGAIAVIAERKTFGDLCGSISSKHLQEQMCRMTEKCKATGARPLLIIECDKVHSWEGKHGGLGLKYVDCVLLKYSLEGVSVLRTSDTAHTRDVVKWIMDRCTAGKVPTFAPTLNFKAEAGQTYRKKDFGGGTTPWASMLTAIPGVSKAKAKVIVKGYASARALVKHLEAKKPMAVAGIGKVTESAITKALLGDM